MRLPVLFLLILSISLAGSAYHPENHWIQNRIALINDLNIYLNDIKANSSPEEIAQEFALAINFLEPLARTKSPYSAMATSLMHECQLYLKELATISQ